MVRAAIYARVSSRQQRDRHTIESQLTTLPRYVEAQGWSLAGTYVDDGRTARAGHLEEREAFGRLLADARAGRLDVVVVVAVDRLTRTESWEERGQVLGAFQRAGVRIAIAPTGQILDLATGQGDLLVGLGAFFAAEDNRQRREKATRAHAHSIEQGRLPKGHAPYGLAYDLAAHAFTLAPEAAIVRELYERIAAGESARAVGRDLERRGVPSPRGGRWPRCVWRIIRLPTYRGEWVCDHARGGIVSVPAIVDEELWAAAQEGLRSWRTSAGRPARSPRVVHEHLCRGLLVCGLCGARVWTHREAAAHRGGRDDGYYMCSARRDPGAEGRCSLPMRRVGEIDGRVWARVRQLLAEPHDLLLEQLAGRRGEAAEERAAWAQDLAGWERRLERLIAVELEVIEHRAAGRLSERAAAESLERLATQRRALEEQVQAARAAQASLGAEAGRAGALARALEELRQLPDGTTAQRRRVLAALLAVPAVLGADGRVTLTIRPLGRACAAPCGSGSSCGAHVTQRQGGKVAALRLLA